MTHPTNPTNPTHPGPGPGPGADETRPLPAGSGATAAPPPRTPQQRRDRPPGATDGRRAPRLFTILLGVLALVVAGFVLVAELADVRLDWSVGGPYVVIAAGLVLAALGLVGVATSRRR